MSWLGIVACGVKERVSVRVFHYMPKMLTSVESTATLALEALAESNWLLDAQLLKLNLVSYIMYQRCRGHTCILHIT